MSGTTEKSPTAASAAVPTDAVLEFLRKHNLKDAERLFNAEFSSKTSEVKQEPVEVKTEPGHGQGQGHHQQPASTMLNSYKTDNDPAIYEDAYHDLVRFVDGTLDLYRHELSLILYPVFVHMYLELVYNRHEAAAKRFVERYGNIQESFFQEDIKKLSYITKRQHMIGSELMENFQTSQFTVRMSRDTYSQLRQQKKFLSERKHAILWNIIQEHLYLDVYEGIARNKSQISATAGGMIGEANRQANRSKVYYGLPKEPDVTGFLALPDDDDEDDKDGKPKKKKVKKDGLAALKKQKNDPNAPAPNRIPFPDMRDVDKIEKAKVLKEGLRRQTLAADSLPSVCFYSVMNSGVSVSAIETSDDSSLLALGFTNSHVKVWSLQSHKLRGLKPTSVLQDLDVDADDVLHRMLEDIGSSSKNLHGHGGPVYGLSFSPDRTLLLSCSEDGTIRLWSLLTWTCIVCYRGHILPIWDVKFSHAGYYFASAGHDRTVRLWTTEQSQCVRIFVGHFSDVDCLTFHPNNNYVASGSSDRSVRLWDGLTGNCVRLMTGHKAAISAVEFSVDGRFLVSGGNDNRVLVWDIAHGHLVGDFSHHKSLVTSLSFSRDGGVLASASNDLCLNIWDFAKFASELNLEEVNVTHNPAVETNAADKYRLATFRTKESPIMGIHFTRRNLLLAFGPYSG